MRVLVLGGSGMLGSVVTDVLSRDNEFEIVTTVRNPVLQAEFSARLPKARWELLDAEQTSVETLRGLLRGSDFAVNAIGVIKPYIHDDNPVEVLRAMKVNAVFPHLLAEAAEKENVHVAQIATDCVYSGARGNYKETDSHDALDAYGKTKSLGEVKSSHLHHIRGSIIGPEPKAHVSLLDWFLSQPKGAQVRGFSNHRWNGVTTLAFANVCRGVAREKLTLHRAQHLIASEPLTKADMLKAFTGAFGREDVRIDVVEAPTIIDRTLSTLDPDWNRKLWLAAGYSEAPSVTQMIADLGRYEYPWSRPK